MADEIRPGPDDRASEYALLSVIVPVFNERTTVAEHSGGSGPSRCPSTSR